MNSYDSHPDVHDSYKLESLLRSWQSCGESNLPFSQCSNWTGATSNSKPRGTFELRQCTGAKLGPGCEVLRAA